MVRYRKKPVVVEATQWFKVGDHNQVVQYEYPLDSISESIGISNDYKCDICKRNYTEHGWINTLEGGHIVCPGDWIIKGIHGEFYPCKPDIFEKTYEKIDKRYSGKYKINSDSFYIDKDGILRGKWPSPTKN